MTNLKETGAIFKKNSAMSYPLTKDAILQYMGKPKTQIFYQ